MLRYVLRRMFRSRGFSAMVIVTIVLGIGVNIGILAIINAIFLNSLGVPESNRLVYYTIGSGRDMTVKFAIEWYEELRANAATKDVLAWRPVPLTLETRSEDIVLNGALVTGNTFSVLGLKPYLGRFFGEVDDVEGGGKSGWTAVLGYSCWKARWGANPKVVGQTINLNGATVRIVGVLPREFTGVEPFKDVDILVPRHFEAVTDRMRLLMSPNALYLAWFVLGRLPSGVSIRQAQADLNTFDPSFRRAVLPNAFAILFFPNTPSGTLLRVHDGQMGVTPFRSLRDPLLMLQGLAVAVLLFCCCNLILLFIGRTRREAHATAIRLVLGARVSDQVRLATTEAATLVTIGCLAAVPVAWVTAHLLCLAIQSAPGFDRFPDVSPIGSFLLLAMGIAIAAGCLTVGGASLWIGMRRSCVSLREANHAVAARSRSWIIGFEVLASIVLVTAAMISVVGFQSLSHRSGFNVGAIMTKFTGGLGSPELTRILNRIQNSPGVQAVATANVLPLSGSKSVINVEAYGPGGEVRELTAWDVSVSIDYFSAIGTKIVRGRDFKPGDLGGDTVCILGSNAASVLFPSENPIDKFLHSPACRIVGIAEGTHFGSMSEPADAVLYNLSRSAFPPIIVSARTTQLAVQAVRDAAQGEVGAIEPVGAYVDKDLRLWKVITISGTLCALLAGIVLAIGFFGILSLQVAERRREIGIRLALGADLTRVSTSLLKKIGPAIMVGLALGTPGALFAAARLAEVYELRVPILIAVFLGSTALLGLLMLAAAAVPLNRALALPLVECLSGE